uniref:mitogen-activated protein kinase kinase n=1 Tax=Phallusia mammillata TaxID=59560 RepID=A0A6F9DKV8_9ASCI|nr:MAPKK5 dual specificity mitogen-activated protein kinase kinase 5 [Phallusia mammillata]
MESARLIIRIVFDVGHEVDWHVSAPQDVTFRDVLDVIAEASDSQLVVSSFEYKDDDGDRITVKSDDELRAMINFHISMPLKIEENQQGTFIDENQSYLPNVSQQHLLIYPKICKHPRMRNKHDLRVAIAPTASSLLLADGTAPAMRQEYPNGMYQTGIKDTSSNLHTNKAAPAQHVNQQYMSVTNTSSQQQATEKHIQHKLDRTLNLQLGTLGNDALLFLEVLGNGNSGVVRKAVHRESNTVTAVKSITLDLTGEEQQQILRELEILRRCNGSPNIIAFYGAYFDENRVLLCTEYMDGGSLDRYGKIPEAVLINVASSISFGLRHLWSLRIMHRDVKPSNVLVNTAGHVKLCDFGVSTQLVDSIARTYVGTNAYMAPERIIGHDYTIYSDVWSFGLSLCELATGKFPYQQLASKIEGSKGVLPMELMQCIVNEPPPRLTKEHFSSELVDFTKCCLQKEASRRLLPEQLCGHSMVTTNQQTPIAENQSLVANWIYQKLQTFVKR